MASHRVPLNNRPMTPFRVQLGVQASILGTHPAIQQKCCTPIVGFKEVRFVFDVVNARCTKPPYEGEW